MATANLAVQEAGNVTKLSSEEGATSSKLT